MIESDYTDHLSQSAVLSFTSVSNAVAANSPSSIGGVSDSGIGVMGGGRSPYATTRAFLHPHPTMTEKGININLVAGPVSLPYLRMSPSALRIPGRCTS